MRTFHQWLKENSAYKQQMFQAVQELAKELKDFTGKTYSIALTDAEGYDDPAYSSLYTLYINGEEIMDGELDEIYSRLRQIAGEHGI